MINYFVSAGLNDKAALGKISSFVAIKKMAVGITAFEQLPVNNRKRFFDPAEDSERTWNLLCRLR
jgi:hypothetical protein